MRLLLLTQIHVAVVLLGGVVVSSIQAQNTLVLTPTHVGTYALETWDVDLLIDYPVFHRRERWITGDYGGADTASEGSSNGYAVFDLSQVTQPIIGATLRFDSNVLFPGRLLHSIDPDKPVGTLSINKVSTDVSELIVGTTSPPREGGFESHSDVQADARQTYSRRARVKADLWSGAYGVVDVFDVGSSSMEVELNLSALIDLNNANGLFAVGGGWSCDQASIEGLPPSLPLVNLLIGESCAVTAQDFGLVLQTVVVPEPNSLNLVWLVIVCLTVGRRYR